MIEDYSDLEQSLSKLLLLEVELNYKGLICMKYSDGFWIAEYESYFNPHTKPCQLMDIAKFDNSLDAAKFFLEFIKSREMPE
jgi:hypothetical protein